jgi:hypothetical protein
MQTKACYPEATPPPHRTVPVFSIVAAYEDFTTGRRAECLCDFIESSLVHEWRAVRHLWKFELLEVPALRKLAAQDADAANLILIACHRQTELPPGVLAWTELWRARHSRAVGLMGLFDHPPGQAAHGCLTQTYLKHLAQQTHLEFVGATLPAEIS